MKKFLALALVMTSLISTSAFAGGLNILRGVIYMTQLDETPGAAVTGIVASGINAAFDLAAGIKLHRYSRAAGDGWGKFLGVVLIVLDGEDTQDKMAQAFAAEYGLSTTEAQTLSSLMVVDTERTNDEVTVMVIESSIVSELADILSGTSAETIAKIKTDLAK